MERSDAEKLSRLYELYEQPMYRIAYAVLHNSGLAEDAVSEAFVRLIGKISRLDDADSPRTKAYVVKVIKSTSISIYRRSKRTFLHEFPINEETMKLPDIYTDIEGKVLADSAGGVLGGLNETDRKIVVLRCRDELPWKDVADKVSLTETAARKRFERARRRIIKMRGEKYDEN